MLPANPGAEGGKEKAMKIWKPKSYRSFFLEGVGVELFYALIVVVLTQTYMCVKIHRPVHQRNKVNVIVLQFEK